MKRLKRFYDTVDIQRVSNDQYKLLLNGKSVKTPLGSHYVLPSEPVASAIATEWELQQEFVIPNTMPMNTILMTNIDLDSNMERSEKLAQINKYFQTDTLRFPDLDTESNLSRLQAEKWKPILDFLVARNVRFTQATGGFALPPSTEDEILEMNDKLLSPYDSLKLTMLETASKYLKSGSTAVGLIDGVIGPEQAFEAANVEELAQRAEWGLVEGDHDLHDAETRLWLHGIGFLSDLVRV
jgi:ATP synthase F1 complex assembly factor 2